MNGEKSDAVGNPMRDLLEHHPLPWNIHPDFPRPGMSPDCDGVVMDANGKIVICSSEWFNQSDGAIELMVEVLNRAHEKERE